jgi:hypothetical protein
MAYTTINFKSKKAFKEALAAGKTIGIYSPGLGGPYNGRSKILIEGPHYPEPHRWYALVDADAEGNVAKIRS